MSDPTITNNDLGQVIITGRAFQDNALTLAGGPTTVKAGTILARDTVTKKLVIYVKGASGDNGTPVAVMGYEASKATSGDLYVRPCIDGDLNTAKLVIHADGSAVNVDSVVKDALRVYGLIALDATELQVLDNQ